MQRMYLKNESPEIEVCINYEFGRRIGETDKKFIQSVTVKMMGKIKELYPYDTGCRGGSLEVGLQHAINGTMPKIHKIDERMFMWISQVFWGTPEAWTEWHGECPYFK